MLPVKEHVLFNAKVNCYQVVDPLIHSGVEVCRVTLQLVVKAVCIVAQKDDFSVHMFSTNMFVSVSPWSNFL